MIAVIDYGRGNLRSVVNALREAGASAELVSDPDGLQQARGVVLPGVGAFGDCADGLDQRGLRGPLLQWLSGGRPYLGICLGYQILFESSEESPGKPGLGFLKGRVVRFPKSELKVPHMGWNSLKLEPAPCWKGLPDNPHVYFVHSYYPEPTDGSLISARCDYGVEFAAAIARGNLWATQFHPEKSQEVGLRILKNFLTECK